MARGWGRSEEDLGAEKEHARDAARAPGSGSRSNARAAAEAHSIRLSLARIEDQLKHTTNDSRRKALETARRELTERLAALGAADPGGAGGADS
jgi:hypothetical protein